ncbi:MAG: hypothetical protein LJE67_02190 [Salaquimonas sp.]|jgi:hypothetical protein|nr:hypothetical protein [Salaquimonas sp.]
MASFRAFHFVTDSVRVVREMSRHGFTIRAMNRDFGAVRHNESTLRPTPGARVFRFDDAELPGQVLAGSGELVFEGETLERANLH